MPATVSVQLYSCREHLDDLDGTLARLAGFGLTQVEAFHFDDEPELLAEAVKRAGLSAPTGHGHLLSDELRIGDFVMACPPQDKVLKAAATAGLGWVIDPMTQPTRWTTMEGVQDLAAQLNEAAKKAADLGLRVGYHNHNQELLPKLGGRTALEVFADLLDDGIQLEIDVFWAYVSGEDPVALLGRLGDRVGALHLKDSVHDVAGMEMFEVQKYPQAAVGSGKLPLAEAIAAAPSAELLVIEFDTWEGDVFTSIEDSYTYLRGLGLR